MKSTVIAAITGAINTYIQQEEQAAITPSMRLPHPEISPWRIFGRQELMRARTQLRVRRTSR